MVLGGVIHVLVYTENDRDVLTLCRSGNDHLLYRPAQMLRGVFRLGEAARGFYDDLSADGRPVDGGRVLFGKYLEALTLDIDRVSFSRDLLLEIAHHRVVLQEMSERFCVREIVDGDEIDVLASKARSHDVASYTAESVNANFDTHF